MFCIKHSSCVVRPITKYFVSGYCVRMVLVSYMRPFNRKGLAGYCMQAALSHDWILIIVVGVSHCTTKLCLGKGEM